MSQNPGTLDATGDVATESKQDDVIVELKKIVDATPQGDDAFFFFTDTSGSKAMNVNPGFSGTPELVHNGEDSTEYTASNLVGSNFVFNSLTHAKNGKAEVLIFGNLSGATVTVNGTNITNTTVTEGVNWTAATSNTATATSLASALNGVTGISATSSAAVVTIVADDAAVKADITTFTTNASASDLTTSARSVSAAAAVNGDTALFTRASGVLDFENFTTLTLGVFIIDWSSAGTTKEIELQFRNSGTNVGNVVNLSEFIDIGTQNEWLTPPIGKSRFGITTQDIDEFTVKVVDVGAGDPPSVFLDILQIEQSGTPVEFTVEPPSGFMFEEREVIALAVGPSNNITGRSSVPDDFFFSIPELQNGFVVTVQLDSIAFDTDFLRSNFDLLSSAGSRFELVAKHPTEDTVMIQFVLSFEIPGIKFLSSRGDKHIETINDDLTALDRFESSIAGALFPE